MAQMRINKRLVTFASIFLFVAATVGWALHRAWTTLAEVEILDRKFSTEIGRGVDQLADIQRQYAEYAGIAEHLPKLIYELNDSLLAYAAQDDLDQLKNFQRQSQELKVWLEQEKASVTQMKLIFTQPVVFTVDAKQFVENIDRAYDAYLAAARELTSQATPPADRALKLKQFGMVQRSSRSVLALTNQAYAQSEAIKLSLFTSEEWFPRMHKMISEWIPTLHRRLILASIVSVLGLCTALSVLVYRLWVSPLRTKLVESDSIIQRQEKFAHLGELAAVVAHEIKNPLTAINARLYTLQRALAEGSTEHADATVIRTEIQRLDQIVKDFLRLDRPNEGQRTRLAAEPLLKEIQSLFASHLEKQSIALTVESAAECQLLGDAQQLKQVLINLVQNAADSIQQDGAITLRARDSTARLKGLDVQAVILEVEDTGPGIAPEVQEKLFHPFFTTKVDGTGLGLPISARIIDKLGGKIDFQTRLHHGTTFRIILPVADRK